MNHAGPPPRLVADACLRLHGRSTPGKVAVADGRRSLTYARLDERVDRIAATLQGLGLEKGDRLAVYMGNRIEWAEPLFGCARAGIVCVPVNGRFRDEEVAHVLGHSGAVAVVAESRLAPRIAAIRASLEHLPHDRLLCVDPDPPAGFVSLEAAMAAAPAVPAPVDVDEDDCWYLGYTSGTTGRPKAAVITHRPRTISAYCAAIEYGVNDASKTLVVMPLFHANGIFFLQLMLTVGGTAHVAEQFDARGVLEAIDAHGITLVSLVPTMYALILALPDEVKARHRLDSLKATLSSSAPLPGKVKEEMLAFFPGASIHEFYGSTEAGFVTNLRPRDQMRKLRSVGQAFVGVEIRLLDERGDEVPAGVVGELWSRGLTHSPAGYWNDPEATRAAYREGGWFSAGDLAMRDEEGYVYIVDRKKDLIITGGENVYPTEIEDVLLRHPAILEVAVVGVPDDVWGDRVCAVVVPRGAEAPTLADLRAWAKERIADYKCPREVRVVESLDKGPTGKLLRRAIRDRVVAHTRPGGAA
jgi:acyl-CoA synthetase (AMP-forming)/AMP-acid ligase II